MSHWRQTLIIVGTLGGPIMLGAGSVAAWAWAVQAGQADLASRLRTVEKIQVRHDDIIQATQRDIAEINKLSQRMDQRLDDLQKMKGFR